MIAASLAQTLAEVSEAVRRATQQLASDWEALAGGRTADVLGADDLPALIAQVARGGKLVRPSMAHLGWQAVGGEVRGNAADVVTAGAALELLHLFALVHDDIMDASPVRRGRPTIHVLAADLHAERGVAGHADDFGRNIAILAGDLLHAAAEWEAAKLPADAQRVWRVLVTELVLGQRRDLTGAARGRRDMEHAIDVAQVKSGAYTTRRPLQLGAVLGGGTPAQLAALDAYGIATGEAFALRDDVLGLWGDPAVTGKPAGDDLRQGKATVLLALAHERLDGDGRASLARAGTDGFDDAEADALLLRMERDGIRDEVEHLITTLVADADAALAGADLDPDAVAGLARTARALAWRDA